MLTEAAVSGEGFVANGATVGFVARMNSHVLSKIIILEKRLAAFLANGLFLSLVLRQNVLVQVLFGDQSSTANRTLELCLVMGVLLMRVQTVTVLAGLPANVAYHR